MEHKLTYVDYDNIVKQVLEISMEFDFQKRMKMYRELSESMMKNFVDWSTYEGSESN